MAYTDDAVKAKLSSLNETQEAIVSVAQWIMFHKRQADRTVQLWAQRLRDSPAPRRLNLIYLANEVVQQSKARRKTEFVNAFQPMIADSTAVAYKGATIDIQGKIKRVVDVWKQRAIFDPACQQDIENRLNDVDRSRGGPRKGALGGSLFASSAAPPEYQALITTTSSLAKSEVLSKPAVSGASVEWEKFNDPSATTPTPPVQAARLGALLKTLANAEGAVAESIKARKSLVEGLEKILLKHKEALLTEETQLRELNGRKVEIEGKKRDVEDTIMRGLAASSNGGGTPDHDPPRPDAEPLTPPPIESITPTGTPTGMPTGFVSTTGADVIEEQPVNYDEPAPPPFEALPTGSIINPNGAFEHPQLSTSDFGEALPGIIPHPREVSPGGAVDDRGAKRRKMSAIAVDVDEFAGFAEEGTGIDADVEALLG